VAPTQEALYRDLDLELSWSERELPERERTKHVHRLHPYLGKFIPQLVEVLLARYFRQGQHVLDSIFAMVAAYVLSRFRERPDEVQAVVERAADEAERVISTD
jgi:hypothetical protein